MTKEKNINLYFSKMRTVWNKVITLMDRVKVNNRSGLENIKHNSSWPLFFAKGEKTKN